MSLKELVNHKGKYSQFQKKGIETIDDLLNFYPRDYLDYKNPKRIKDLTINENHAVIGKIKDVKNHPKVTKFIIEDIDKNKMELVFFKAGYVQHHLLPGLTVLVCGKVEWNDYGQGGLQMVNPDYYLKIEEGQRIQPVYSKIDGMSQNYLENTIKKALDTMDKKEYLTEDIIERYKLVSFEDKYKNLHNPNHINDILEGNRRRIFDELFRFSMIMNYNYMDIDKTTNVSMKNANTIKPFLSKLPFELTDDQINTVRIIYSKMRDGERTSSLVQGDVGCGKTMVAILLMLIAVENNYQAALMAPTNVLAYQHYLELEELTKDMDNINVVFLTGSLSKKEKDEALEGISNGKYNLIIGTHTLVSESVVYHNLGIAIVDEEHRFGVLQREGFEKRTDNDIHMVSMSATPIPRTLALTIYGNGTDVYTIKTMPSGRQPVSTKVSTNRKKAYDFLYKEILKGHQGYIVCPLIEESESEMLEDVLSVEETYEEVINYFKDNPEIKVGMITGNMKKEEVEQEIDKYKNLEYNIIISTTIIEVGVNVPNSTVIIIQNSERFGLAQLHQLRGRVGRGSYKSYCILITEKKNVPRLEIMEKTNDGFIISQEDLKLRGLGDFIGTQQSGDNEAVILMLKYPILYDELSKLTLDILKDKDSYNHYKFLIEDYDMEKESEQSMKQYNLEKTEPFRR